MDIRLRYIGKSADDLRFFIVSGGRHAGGVTVYSIHPPVFSYGVAVRTSMRRQGVARAALTLLFAQMHARGFTRAVVQIEEGNAASLALHASLGFRLDAQAQGVLTLSRPV